MKILRIAAILFAATMNVPSQATAQTFPDKFVKVITAAPPGGIQDQLIRLLGVELHPVWKQPLVVESRPGAGAMLAIEAVRQARPDGYTILQMDNINIFTNATLREKKPPYDFAKVMMPVRSIARTDGLFIASPNVPANTVQEFIALAKASPGKFTYGSFGPGASNHIEMEAFAEMVGIKLTHVPYRGGGPLTQAMQSGEVSVAFVGVAAGLAQAREGKLKALAYLGKDRSPMLPDVPTLREAGVPYDLIPATFAWWVPEGTPSAVIEKLSQDVGAALTSSSFKKALEPLGFETLDEPAPVLRAQIAAQGKLFEARALPLGIKLGD